MIKQKITTYKNLIVYKRSKSLSIDIIQYFSNHKNRKVPEFIYTQLFRSVCSIPANIVEGYGRYYKGNYRHFLSIQEGLASSRSIGSKWYVIWTKDAKWKLVST